jgi:hypothetical protein
MSSLDVLPDTAAIARFLYDSDDKTAQRRVRRKIAQGEIPVRRTSGGHFESRKSWIEAVYAEPDPFRVQNGREDEPEPDLPQCAVKHCTEIVKPRASIVGRPTKYCAKH